MDPASVFAIVEGAGSLALKCVSLAKTLNDVASKYKQAKLTVLSMVQQIDVVQLAWERIDKWSQTLLKEGIETQLQEGDVKLLERLQKSLNVGHMVMEALEEDLLPFQRQLDHLGFRGKTSLIWQESALTAHQDRLGHQVQAMTCLLQTIDFKLPQSRVDMLSISEPILLKSDESAYSIVPSRMSSRLSQSTIQSYGSALMQYKHLSFEDSLFTARVYKRSYRSPLIEQLLKTQKSDDKSLTVSKSQGTIRQVMAIEQALPGSPASRLGFSRKSYSISSSLGSESVNKNSDSRPSLTSDTADEQLAMDFMFASACEKNAEAIIKGLLVDEQGNASERISLRAFRSTFADAVEEDRLDAAQTLLDLGPKSYVTQLMNRNGRLLIYKACAKSQCDLLKLLLKHVDDQGDPVARFDLNGRLFQAAKSKNAELLAILIEAGADANSADAQGLRPLHLISLSGNETGCSWHIQKLLQIGADINEETLGGMTPILFAAARGRLLIVKCLVSHGANFAIRDKLDEQVTDKLRRLARDTEAAPLCLDLEVLRNASINTLNNMAQFDLQRASGWGDDKPIRVALEYRGQKPFLDSLETFVETSFESIPLTLENMTTTYEDRASDLTSNAQKLRLVGPSSLWLEGQVILDATVFIIAMLYELLEWRREQADVDISWQRYQPLRKILNDGIFKPSTRVALRILEVLPPKYRSADPDLLFS